MHTKLYNNIAIGIEHKNTIIKINCEIINKLINNKITLLRGLQFMNEEKNYTNEIKLRINLVKSYNLNGEYDLIKQEFQDFKSSASKFSIDNAKYYKNDRTGNYCCFNTIEDGISFETLKEEYYDFQIICLEYLTQSNKKYVNDLILLYIEIFEKEPKIKSNNLLTGYLFDLCKYLYEYKETSKLTFFYSLMDLSKKIPYINVSEAVTVSGEKDSFADLREEERKNEEESFDEKSFNDLYNKFFERLYLWKERTEGYYLKDEVFYMTALFIVREYIPAILTMYGLGWGDNILDDTEKNLNYHYDQALKFFKKAINSNPNNPNYYYEYANCLRQSGKSKEAEVFFKRAFELNL